MAPPRPIDVQLARDLRRSVRSGHPWLYRDALRPFSASPGDPVRVLDRDRRVLGAGVAEGGPIAVRLWTSEDEPVDERLVRRRIAAAAALRRRLVPPATDAYRLLHGEGDRLGGVVCDRYGDHLVVSLDGQATEPWAETIVGALKAEAPAARGILLHRGPRGGRQREVVEGDIPEPVVVEEHGMRLPADLQRGQKTGLFLDHRESRRRVRRMAEGLRVLNLYGYTGGFSIGAGLGGARQVDTVDQAPEALRLAERGWALNGLAPRAHCTRRADVPAFLQEAKKRGDRWDLIVADPPSFAPKRSALDAALESYRLLHRACLERLPPGGLYLAASCSSHVDRAAFDDTLREGARRARVVLQILDRWGAPPDHPRLSAFPEGDYLKVVLARIVP